MSPHFELSDDPAVEGEITKSVGNVGEAWQQIGVKSHGGRLQSQRIASGGERPRLVPVRKMVHGKLASLDC